MFSLMPSPKSKVPRLVKVALLLPVVIIISIVLVAVAEAGMVAVPPLVILTVLQVIVAITVVVLALFGQAQTPLVDICLDQNTTSPMLLQSPVTLLCLVRPAELKLVILGMDTHVSPLYLLNRSMGMSKLLPDGNRFLNYS